jgi:hypothetical protein
MDYLVHPDVSEEYVRLSGTCAREFNPSSVFSAGSVVVPIF